MKKILYFAVLVIMMIVCAESCKKDPIVTPDPINTEITGEVISVEQTTAVVNGTVSPDAKQVGVCWDTVSNPTVEKNQMAANPINGKFAVTISRLLPNKEYYARIYSVKNGTYIYSVNLPFETKPKDLAVCVQPATSIGLHEAVLNGLLVIPYETTFAYWFEWGETVSYGNKTPEQTLTKIGSNNVNSAVTGLDWHKVYHFRLGITANNQTLYSDDAQFSTLGDQPTIEGSMIIDNEQLDKIILTSRINPNSITTTVVFEWGKTDYNRSITLNPINGSTGIEVSTEITVERAQEYHFRVKAENAIGTTYSSDTSSVSLAVIDADGNKFHACKIGNQYWLTANWRMLKYNNGDPIPNITDPVAWGEQTQGALCFYDNDPANFAVYGPLYNWYVISDPRGICPPGWHVPTWNDLDTLYEFVYKEGGHGGSLKEAGLEHWYPVNAYGTNSTGFTALPGGGRGNSMANPTPEEKGTFMGLHTVSYFWSSDSYPDPACAYQAFMMGSNGGLFIAQSGRKYYGESLRLIKD